MKVEFREIKWIKEALLQDGFLWHQVNKDEAHGIELRIAYEFGVSIGHITER
ncbi:unnamed protein product [Acidithrix sp. C25]|nr:unnamed protein product [Acidithrix sp. C25]